MKILFFFTILVSPSLGESESDSVSMEYCLLKKELYHRATNTCIPPLLQGPCIAGEWLVLDGVHGEGVCRPVRECPPGREALLSPTEGVVCGCPDGQEEIEGSCENLFSQSICKRGEVLMPEYLNHGRETCSAGFSCTQSASCTGFTVAKTELSKKGSLRRKEKIRFLKELVCSRDPKSICCPDNNNDSLLTSHNIIQSMMPVVAKCVKNPCGQGLWPWAGPAGGLQCLKRGEDIETCPFPLTEEDGHLVCPIFSLRTVAPKPGRNCGRRRRWSYGRCRRIFG